MFFVHYPPVQKTRERTPRHYCWRRCMARTCCLQFGQTNTLQRTGALSRCAHLSQEANSPSSKKLLAAASSSPGARAGGRVGAEVGADPGCWLFGEAAGR